MEEQYYSELKHSIVGYKNVTTIQILDHLDKVWVTMNTKEKKKIKADYYKPWDVAGGVALSAFTKALDERKEELIHHNITIDEEDIKEHYMVQMYHSRAFAEADMKEWENKSVADRDDWSIMKRFFRDKMTLNEAYTNNNEGNEANVYGSSANITDEQEDKLADMGDQIREYIQQITQAKENVPPTTKTNSTETSSTGNTAVDEMNKRMAKLENMISNMCNSNNNNSNRGGGGRTTEAAEAPTTTAIAMAAATGMTPKNSSIGATDRTSKSETWEYTVTLAAFIRWARSTRAKIADTGNLTMTKRQHGQTGEPAEAQYGRRRCETIRKPMSRTQESWRQPTDRDWGRHVSIA
jgi:hypothetical protein